MSGCAWLRERLRVAAGMVAWALMLAGPAGLCGAEPEGLRLVGAVYHASDAWVVMEGFAVQPSSSKVVQWAVPEPGLKGQKSGRGRSATR